jgi:hypothetical protein
LTFSDKVLSIEKKDRLKIQQKKEVVFNTDKDSAIFKKVFKLL